VILKLKISQQKLVRIQTISDYIPLICYILRSYLSPLLFWLISRLILFSSGKQFLIFQTFSLLFWDSLIFDRFFDFLFCRSNHYSVIDEQISHSFSESVKTCDDLWDLNLSPIDFGINYQ
jgi:hypothetical protein